jgi:general nucleoside transport system permease protein
LISGCLAGGASSTAARLSPCEVAMNVRGLAQSLSITVAAFLASMVVFGLFMMFYTGLFTDRPMVWPHELFYTMFVGAFGSKLQFMISLTKAAPLILTALCTALPARLGLVVIGAEGALLTGGITSISVGLLLQDAVPPIVLHMLMAVAAMIAGGLCIALIGALNHGRGVNATISSLLVTYIIIGVFTYLVEGPMKDPASLNKPSTYPLAKEVMMGNMFGLDLHWGLALGVVFCLFAYVLMDHTIFGFAARMAGGNLRAAQGSGLPVGWSKSRRCMARPTPP